MQNYWGKMRRLLFECDQIKIERWIGLSKQSNEYSIHGFSDAFERTYASVAYLRTECPDGTIKITLLAAKFKVAPLQKITLPRLELCGALLLCKLITKIKKALELPEIPIYAYSDSQIVLDWLRKHPINGPN